MQIERSTPLLGGLSACDFMRRHWQKKPLLVRAAVPDAPRLTSRSEVFGLAARDAVESRLVVRDGEAWSLRHGPFARRALPALKTPRWTLLVQGADLHLEAAHRLLGRFRFVPDARLDDLMLSFATDGGGVGPHLDSYDVFLLQVRGRRRWRIGRPGAAVLREDVPLRMLAGFVPTAQWLLEPGDMLYLPPGWGHDGVAEGEAITASIGFRASGHVALGVEVLQHLLDAVEPPEDERRYADRDQPATATPARIPPALQRYAGAAVERLLRRPGALEQALGAALSEPKPGTWFDAAPAGTSVHAPVVLDRRSRMLYDDRHVFLNGEAYRAAGADAKIVRRLADRRRLSALELEALGADARVLLAQWLEAGWLRHESDQPSGEE
jgi:50S ribosomal protein L16 3-hydroxylase